MMRRHVVVPYPASNSSVRTRALHWIDRLVAQDRIDRDEVELHGPGFAARRVAAGEPVLLLRNARRLTRGRRESQLLRRASHGVYDLDDGLPWDDGNLPYLGRWWKRPFPKSLVARRAGSAADRVIAGNELIAEWASALCGDVVVVPTCVEPTDYEIRTTWEIGPGGPVVGWIGSSATEHYLFDLAPMIAAAQKRLGFRLEIVSGDGSIPASMAAFTTRRLWTPSATRCIARWDLGLMPLRDGVYERAKCGYKLLQYAASGVPAIGSPVGVNASFLHEMDGLAPRTKEEWVDAICEVLGESVARRARRARRGAGLARRYSYDTWQTVWLAAAGW